MKKVLLVLLFTPVLVACGQPNEDASFEADVTAQDRQPVMSCEQKKQIFQSNCGSGFQGCGDDVYSGGSWHAQCTCNGSTSTSAACEPMFA